MDSALTPAKQEQVDQKLREAKVKGAVDRLLSQRIGSKYVNYQQYWLSDGRVAFVNVDNMTVRISEADSKTAKYWGKKVKAADAKAEDKIAQEKLLEARKDRKQREAEKKAAPKSEPKPKAVKKPRAKKAQATPTAEPTQPPVDPTKTATVYE